MLLGLGYVRGFTRFLFLSFSEHSLTQYVLHFFFFSSSSARARCFPEEDRRSDAEFLRRRTRRTH